MKIGEKIRTLRLKKGISPEKLGKLIDISGIYIRRLEKGESKSITLTTARKLASGLGVPVSALVDQDELPRQDIKDADIAAFFHRELPGLKKEDKELLRHSINIIRERVREREKYKSG